MMFQGMPAKPAQAYQPPAPVYQEQSRAVMQALEESRAAAAAAMQAADQARHQALQERRERERVMEELDMLRDTVAAEGQRRAHAERVAAAAEHAAQAAAEDADYTRELLEQANARTPARALDPRTTPPPGVVRTAEPDRDTQASTPPRRRRRFRRRLKRRSSWRNSRGDLRSPSNTSVRFKINASGTSARRPHPSPRSHRRHLSARGPSTPARHRPCSARRRRRAAEEASRGYPREITGTRFPRTRGTMSYGRKIAGLGPNVGYARDPAPTARAQSPYLNPGSASGRERANSFGMGRTSPSSGFHGGGGAYSGYAPPPPQYATPALRRAKKHVALRGDDDLHEAAVAPQGMKAHCARSGAARVRCR